VRSNKEGCVRLRTAKATDLPAVLALLRRADLPAAGISESALADFVVAEESGALVGVAGLELYPESALLRSVAVEESWRGTGVGRALIDEALDRSQERGIRDVFLLTTTAEHYFPRFGFICVGRDAVPETVKASAEFCGACPETAVVMRKTVGRSDGQAVGR
jgi:amino-acid N-acetyltransferase